MGGDAKALTVEEEAEWRTGERESFGGGAIVVSRVFAVQRTARIWATLDASRAAEKAQRERAEKATAEALSNLDMAERAIAHAADEEAQKRSAIQQAEKAEARVVVLEKALREKLPGDTRVRNSTVEYGFSCGRGYLSVNGIVVAIEGDLCRDCTVSGWRHGTPFGAGCRWTCDDFKRIEAEFSAPLRAALEKP